MNLTINNIIIYVLMIDIFRYYKLFILYFVAISLTELSKQ